MFFMAQQRKSQTIGANNASRFVDTTHTKIFVGGLAWETGIESIKRYFERFGEIDEAIVIKDKNTGRSKGYGFVTFKDPDAATRACLDPFPVIDGRKANCNLACYGAHRNRTRPSTPTHVMGNFRPAPQSAAPPAFQVSSPMGYHQPTHHTVPYSAYGYAGYLPGSMYPMNYPGLPGIFSPSGMPGIFPNFYPFYAQYGQSSQTQGGFGIQYPQMVQYPYLPPHYGTIRMLSFPPTPVYTGWNSNSGAGDATMAVMSNIPAVAETVANAVEAQDAPEANIEQNSSIQIIGGEQYGFVQD